MINRICYIIPSKPGFSETFIENRINFFPENSIILFGEEFPTYNFKNKSYKLILPLFYFDKIINRFFDCRLFFLSNLFLIFYLKLSRTTFILCEYGPTSKNFILSLKVLKLPFYIQFHGYDAYSSSVIKENTGLYSTLFYLSKKIVVVSEHMKVQINRLGCPIDKIVVIRCGVLDSFYKISKKQKKEEVYFLSVGRFVNKKAPYLTILAFNEIQKEFPNIKLKMVGDGVLFDMCVQLTKSLGIESKIEFLGVRNSKEIAVLMSESIGFVQHSITALDGDSEGTPVAILEAMAVGLPIVSTYHTGISEVIELGETGFLVNERDYKGMANYMKFIVENPNISKEIGSNAQKYALENFKLEKQIDLLLKTITE